jgi:hypothetical protein
LIVLAHWDGDDFNFEPSFTAAWGMGFNENSILAASAENGPPRAWFTRNAEVRFVGCHTHPLAQALASRVLRIGATAFGTNENLGAAYQGAWFDTHPTYKTIHEDGQDVQVHTWIFEPNEKEVKLTTVEELFNAPHWRHFPGEQ